MDKDEVIKQEITMYENVKVTKQQRQIASTQITSTVCQFLQSATQPICFSGMGSGEFNFIELDPYAINCGTAIASHIANKIPGRTCTEPNLFLR